MSESTKPHVVIVGGGFGGLETARTLRSAPVRVTLIDRRNHHLFQPLLYQVATAGLSAPDIAAPIRKVLRRQTNATVLLGEVERISTGDKHVELTDGERIPYDYVVVAAGSTHSYFGNDEWEKHAPGLKTVNDAFEIRRRILMAYENAERESDPDIVRQWLCFVVVGGGPTGVELAGACAEIAHHSLTRDFRNFDTRMARVVLVEGGERVLSAMPPELSAKAMRQLERLGVEIRLKTFVTRLDETGVWAGDEHIPARVVLWAAGVAASPLGQNLGETDRAGRVVVNPDLSVGEDGSAYVVGDLAHVKDGEGTVPGVAPAAIQQGRHAAHTAPLPLRRQGNARHDRSRVCRGTNRQDEVVGFHCVAALGGRAHRHAHRLSQSVGRSL